MAIHGNRITLKLYDELQECIRDIGFDYVILATGFRYLGVSEEYKFPKVLKAPLTIDYLIIPRAFKIAVLKSSS